ncbi:phage tail protein [Variovorax sp. RKNM96]|uniref:portal protein n=1 Tax=Variovorax sp. RKNM96 TaxID=2681552 RepID=UPI001982667E|nr:portal protein [Variovorax sp. RKNM96]QSI31470.1 phage tail protein [Variovorax sp. RKNM96]
MATLKSEYDRLSSARSPYLTRARDCAKYTLPWLVPVQGASGSTRMRVTYSTYGARCVNSLASKLMLALFPPKQSFFKLGVTKRLEEQLGGAAKKADIDKALASIEQRVLDEINGTNTRTPAGEALKHDIVAGNVLIHMLPEGGLKSYPLSQYVCKRDKAGTPLRIFLEEKVSILTLPDSIRMAVREKLLAKGEKADNVEENLCLYTGIVRKDGRWHVSQEVEGINIPEAAGQYPLDATPWLPLRWIPDSTGDYGRSLVEDYLGSFISLESLTASLVKATAIGAKVVFLRNPSAATSAAKLTRAETGAVIDGKKDDITVVEVGKQVDLNTCRQMIADLKEELAFAFCLNQAIQRNAERVTAEEIRFMAQELDATLGGNYSTLAVDFQLPYIKRLMLQMQRQGKLPQLPKGSVTPVITTGLDALGRGADLDNLKAFVKDIVDLGGPAALKTYLNFNDLLKRLSTARGILSDGLVKTAEEVAAAEQAEQQAAMIQQLGPQAISAMGGIAKQGMANQSQQPQPPQ